MAAGVALSLLWSRLLLDTMGPELNGLFLTFLAIVQLGGVGELGISGAMGIRTMQFLSRGEDEEGQRFLASCRGAIVSLAIILGGIFIVLSPVLPSWLKLAEGPGAGSLQILFLIGGCGVALLILSGYFQSLNYSNGNVVWPILPSFVLVQLGFAAQFVIARWSGPLWSQYACHVIVIAAGVVLGWWMLRSSHPWLANLRPIRFEGSELRALAGMSFWSYLCTLGTLLFVTTDRIVVNAAFGASAVPAYQFNYKPFEIGITLLNMATFVALPAIARRILSLEPEQQRTGIDEALHLRQLHAFSATAFAVVLLGVNDAFITVWIGAEYKVPLLWQVAFALTFVVTIAGDVGVQLLSRLDHTAIRIAGLTFCGAGILNLALSLVAAKLGSILGIALATVLAQSFASLVLSYHTSRRLQTRWVPWVIRGWAIPVAFLLAGAGLRALIPPIDGTNVLLLATADFLLLAVLARVLGLRPEMLLDEWRRMRRIFS